MNTSGNTSITRSQGNDDAVAILGSSPSMLAKIAGFVHDGEDGPRVEWAKVAELAHQKVLPRGDRAFFGICAEIAGFVTGDSDLEETFGARWGALDGQHQAVIASVLTASAQTKKAEEVAVYQRLGVASPDPRVEGSRAVRVRLGHDIPAIVNDALGRERVGFREGLSTHEAWLRGRGVWRMQPDRVLTSQLLIIAHAGIVRMVGTIDGVTIHGDRVAIIGRPLPHHPLLGKPDPLDNTSQNPVAYGDLDELT
ncbi:MAG: hypothetical protein ABIP19_06030 [Dermatophilaceae bacterium]